MEGTVGWREWGLEVEREALKTECNEQEGRGLRAGSIGIRRAMAARITM